LVRHRAGGLGQVSGSDFESGVAGFEFGGWYSSVFEYEDWDSGLYSQQLLVISPSARILLLFHLWGAVLAPF